MAHLEGFIQGLIDGRVFSTLDPRELRPMESSSSAGRLKPFHQSLIPHGILSISEFERSFSTSLGTEFEEIAKLIASDFHVRAERSKRIKGGISKLALERIGDIMDEIDRGGIPRSFLQLAEEVIEVSGEGEMVERQSIIDLYVETNYGQELFIEIKSPKPNKGQCLEVNKRLLTVLGITHEKAEKVRSYYASAYNPHGESKERYDHKLAKRYLDLEEGVLIGEEFWDLMGGVGTYENLLDIFREVGHKKGPDMLDQLSLGY